MSSNKRGRSLAEVMSPIDDNQLSNEESTHTNKSTISENSVAMGPTGQSIVPVNILVAPEDRRRLRQLSLDTSLSLQKLGHEAWNLLLQKRGLPPLKPVSANVPSGRLSSGRAK